MDDGTRTHDDRDHNPGLYQLSYAHHGISNSIAAKAAPTVPVELARPAGLEPATLGLAYQLPLSRPCIRRFVVWTISSPSQAPHV